MLDQEHLDILDTGTVGRERVHSHREHLALAHSRLPDCHVPHPLHIHQGNASKFHIWMAKPEVVLQPATMEHLIRLSSYNGQTRSCCCGQNNLLGRATLPSKEQHGIKLSYTVWARLHSSSLAWVCWQWSHHHQGRDGLHTRPR